MNDFASVAKRIAVLELELESKNEEIRKLKAADDSVILREGLIRVAAQYGRKYRVRLFDPEELNNSELVDKVKQMIKDGPCLDGETSDIATLVTSRLQGITSETSSDISLLLDKTEELVTKMQEADRENKSLLRNTATRIAETVILSGRDDTGSVEANLAVIDSLTATQREEYKQLKRELETVKRQSRMRWYSLCQTLSHKTLPEDISEDDLMKRAEHYIDELNQQIADTKSADFEMRASVEKSTNRAENIKSMIATAMGIKPSQRQPCEEVVLSLCSKLDSLKSQIQETDNHLFEIKSRTRRLCEVLEVDYDMTNKEIIDMLDISISEARFKLKKLKQVSEEHEEMRTTMRDAYEVVSKFSDQPKDCRETIPAREMLETMKEVIPMVDECVRIADINELFHEVGDPHVYIPKFMDSFSSSIESLALITQFSNILDDLFRSLPSAAEEEIGYGNLKSAVSRMRAELITVGNGHPDEVVMSFLSKSVSLMEVLVRKAAY